MWLFLNICVFCLLFRDATNKAVHYSMTDEGKDEGFGVGNIQAPEIRIEDDNNETLIALGIVSVLLVIAIAVLFSVCYHKRRDLLLWMAKDDNVLASRFIKSENAAATVSNRPVVDPGTANGGDGMEDDFDLNSIQPLELWIDEKMSEAMFSIVTTLIILIIVSIVFFTICFYKGRDVLLEKDDTEEETAMSFLASSFSTTKTKTLNSVKSKLPKEAHIYFEPKRLREHMELMYDLYQELPDDDVSSKDVKAIYKEVDQDPTLHLPALGELFTSLDQAVEKKKETKFKEIKLQESRSKKEVAFLDEFQHAVKQLAGESSSLQVSKDKNDKSGSKEEEKRPLPLDEAQSLIKLEKLRSLVSLGLDEKSASEEEVKAGDADVENKQVKSSRSQKDKRSKHHKEEGQKRQDKRHQKKSKRHERKDKDDHDKDVIKGTAKQTAT